MAFCSSFIAVILFSCVAFYFNEFIFDHIILAPKNADFITNKILCLFGNKLNIDYFCVNNLNLKLLIQVCPVNLPFLYGFLLLPGLLLPYLYFI